MRRLKLSLKLPGLVVLAVLLTVLTANLMAILIGRTVIRERIQENNAREVQVYASTIEFMLESARATLEITAAFLPVADMARESLAERQAPKQAGRVDRHIRELTARLAERSKVFDHVILLRGDGSLALLEPSELEGKLSRRDPAFSAWYKQVLDSGRTVVSDLHISPANQKPTIVVATPVRGAGGQITAIWAGALNLAELSGIGRGTSPGRVPGRYGFVTDRRGLIIAHQANVNYVETQTDFSSVPPVRAALNVVSGLLTGQAPTAAHLRFPRRPQLSSLVLLS